MIFWKTTIEEHYVCIAVSFLINLLSHIIVHFERNFMIEELGIFIHLICKHFELVFKQGNLISEHLTPRFSGSVLGHVRIACISK